MRLALILVLTHVIVAGIPPAAAEPLAKQIFSTQELPTISPAASIGSYARGCLAGGVALSEVSPAWQVMRPSRNRNWGHPEMVAFITRLSASARRNGWPGLYVGDISQPRGGPMNGGHRSHQIGLDVDVWLRRPDRMDLTLRDRDRISSTVVVASDGVSVNRHWTGEHHQIIKAAAQDPAVARIFVNPAIKRALCTDEAGSDPAARAWLRKIRPWTGHDAHFHVRLACPARTPGCVDQFPVPAGDGCGADLARWFSDEGQLEITTATRGIGRPDLTLADLPAACQTVASARTISGASNDLGLNLLAPLPPAEPIAESYTAIYGIEGSRYLWVLPFESGNDGGSGMNLETAGVLPPGLALERGLNGRGIIAGVPAAPGDFQFQIIGRDARRIRARFEISLSVEPRRTGGATLASAGRSDRAGEFLRDYDGGDCFYAYPVRILESLSAIEAFSYEVAPLHRLDAAFIAALGFEARIGGRIVGAGHCDALAFVKRIARSGARAPTITLDDVTVGIGDFVSGRIETPAGGAGVLVIVDRYGSADIVATNLRGSMRFSRRTPGSIGPHLLIAVSLPGGRQSAALQGLAGGPDIFDRLLAMDAASGGRSGIAVKYFTVQ